MTKKAEKVFEEYAELLYGFKETQDYCNVIVEYEDRICKIINKMYKII